MTNIQEMYLPSVLVLLASYNGELWIGEQLDSIACQEGVDVHIVISDDCSDDSTLDVIEQKRLEGKSLNVISRTFKSGSAGQNFLDLFRNVDLTNYEYVAFSDQDDIWFPGKLRTAIDALKKSGCGGYSSSVEAFWPSGRSKVLHQAANVSEIDFLFEGGGQGCSFVLAADVFCRVQNFLLHNDDATKKFYYHDWLVYLLVRCWGVKWYFDPSPSMSYRQHGGNDTGARFGFNAVLQRIRLIRSGWYKDQIVLACQLAERACFKHPVKCQLDEFLAMENSLSRRFSIFVFCIRFGRRKGFDRIILAFSGMSGFI